MRTANYSDLRQNLKTYIDSVIEDSDTVIINRGGRSEEHTSELQSR